jgi:hypothetical protein
MDLVPAPGGESSSLKTPVVEVEAVDMTSAEVEGTVATENQFSAQGNASPSEYETDSGDSGDDWENQSLYEDAIRVLRDEQLREGGKHLILRNALGAIHGSRFTYSLADAICF